MKGLQHVNNFSLHHSIDGINHLIAIEANHLLSAYATYTVSNPDLHTSPRGFKIRHTRLHS